MSARTGAAAVIVALALTSCTDEPSTAPVVDSPVGAPALARLRGTVDVATGTLTFDPMAAGPSASIGGGHGISAAVYGDQGVTVRIYNSPVSVAAAGPGKKRYSAQVGVRNLLAHPIGDEQGAIPSSHNLGIFVFVTAGPTVTGTSSPCSPACTVNVVGQHGIFAFTTPGQRYWFWSEQLAPAGQVGDTTLNRKTWTFEADTQVTAFQFDVLVSAAWPPPFDTRWKVNYGGDSLPNNGTEPVWVRSAVGGATTQLNTPSVGMIRILASSGQRLTYFRIDSLGSTSDAYMEARFQVDFNFLLTNPEVSFGFDDRAKFIAAGASSARAGFLTGSGSLAFQTNKSVVLTTSSFHTYQLRKYGADSVVLFIDGARRIHQLYSAFPDTLPGSAHGVYFGPLGTGTGLSEFGNQSNWDYVIFEIGAPQP